MTISLQTALAVAEQMIEYSSKQIIRGASQLENNRLSKKDYDNHWLAIGTGNSFGIRQAYNKKYAEKKSANMSKNEKNFLWFECLIETTSKYSIGNCTEIVMQALDVVPKIHGEIKAECYQIEGGNHKFLVLNRAEYSDPRKPETWGENAVICDPWAKKCFSVFNMPLRVATFVDDLYPAEYILVQDEKSKLPAAIFSVQTENIKVSRFLKLNFLPHANMEMLVKKLFPDVENHLYPKTCYLPREEQLNIIKEMTGHTLSYRPVLAYDKKLKNYAPYGVKNYIENFDKNIHSLTPLGDFNTDFLKQNRQRIVTATHSKLIQLLQSLKDKHDTLQIAKPTLFAVKKTIGEETHLVAPLSRKVVLQTIIQDLKSKIETLDKLDNYCDFREYQNEYKQAYQKVNNKWYSLPAYVSYVLKHFDEKLEMYQPQSNYGTTMLGQKNY